LLKQIFKWAVDQDIVAKNVASHITMYNTADRIILSVAYDLPELAQIYLAAGDLEENERDAIRLICLTGCRRNEVIGARLSDFKGEVWNISHLAQQKRETAPLETCTAWQGHSR
jgi:integrase